MEIIKISYKLLHVLASIEICCTGQPSILSTDSVTHISSSQIKPDEWQTVSFSASDDLRIRVNFTSFNLYPGLDFICIGDGPTADTSYAMFNDGGRYSTLAKFSGATKPSHVTSIRNAVWIGFLIRSVSATFELKISLVNHTDETFLDKGRSFLIESPSYPSDYPKNYYQLWYVQCADGFVVSIIVHHFDLELKKDHLYVGDGSRRFTNLDDTWHDLTGDRLSIRNRDYETFSSFQSSVQLIFTTDFVTVKSGFRIELQAVAIEAKTTLQAISTSPVPSANTVRSIDSDVMTFGNTKHRPTTAGEAFGTQTRNISTKFVIMFGVFSGLMIVTMLVVCLRWLIVKYRRHYVARIDGRIYCSVTESAPALPPPRITGTFTSLTCASAPTCSKGMCSDDTCDVMATSKINRGMDSEMFGEERNIPYLNHQGTTSDEAYACVPDPLSGKQSFGECGETDNAKRSRNLGHDKSATSDANNTLHFKPGATCKRSRPDQSQYVWSTTGPNRLTRDESLKGCHNDISPSNSSTTSTDNSRFPSCNLDEFGYLMLDTSSPKCDNSRRNFQLLSHDGENDFHERSMCNVEGISSARLRNYPSEYSSRRSLSSSSTIEHTYLDRENMNYHNKL